MADRKWILIFATQERTDQAEKNYFTQLTTEAWAVAQNTMPIAACNTGILLLDRHGIETELMIRAQQHKLPLLVVGSSARPATGISTRFYERCIIVKGSRWEMQSRLHHYAVRKAQQVVVIGDTPDCRAMRVYAGLLKKPVLHIAEPTSTKLWSVPQPEWLREFGHKSVVH